MLYTKSKILKVHLEYSFSNHLKLKAGKTPAFSLVIKVQTNYQKSFISFAKLKGIS